MKRLATLLAAATLAMAVPFTVSAQMDHAAMHGSGHGDMMTQGKVAHEETIDGVKATFEVIDMREQMKGMAGMKETHHVMVTFTDAKTGKKITEGAVKIKIQGPDKSEVTKDLKGMQGHFGADFTMVKKGKYGVMAKFKLKDGKVNSARFWYEVK